MTAEIPVLLDNDINSPASFNADVQEEHHPFGLDLSAYRENAAPPQNKLPESGEDHLFGIDLSAYTTPSPVTGENGISTPDAEEYYSPLRYSIPETDPAGHTAVRGMGSPEQRTLAISRVPDLARQARMFALSDDLENLYNLGKYAEPKPEDTKAIAEEIQAPEKMVQLFQKFASDELEARRVTARVINLLGPDSYWTKKLASDPEFAFDWREQWEQLAELQSAITSTYGSTPKIYWDWFSGSVASTANSIGIGIPAWISQMGRELRADQPKELRSGFSDYLDTFDEWIQDFYTSTKAVFHVPPPSTGQFVHDTVARPVVQGAGSYLPSMGMGIIGKGATAVPALAFGASEAGEGYRERSGLDVDPLTNAVTSVVQMGLSATAEHMSLDTLFNQPGLRTMFRNAGGHSNTLLSRFGRLAGGAVKSGGGEAAAEGAQTLLDLASTPLAQGISRGDPAGETLFAVMDNLDTNFWSIIESMWGGFGAGAIGGGTIGSFGREISDAWSYSNFQKAFARVADASKKTAESKKSVEKTRAVVREGIIEANSRGETQLSPTAFADAQDVEHYCQTLRPAEADTLLESIGTNRAALEQAVENRIDIEVATENLAVRQDGGKIADVPPELRRLFRPKPSMPTASFLQAQFSALEETMVLAEQVQTSIQEDIEKGEVPENVATFYTDLIARKVPSREAKADASLLLAWMRTESTRQGVPLEEFAQEHIVRFVTDAFYRRHPEWLAGVKESMLRDPEQRTTEEIDADSLGELFDPALMEGLDNATANDISEQPGLQDATGEPTLAEPGREAAVHVPPGPGGDGGQDLRGQETQPRRHLFEAMPVQPQRGQHVEKLIGLPYRMETVSTSGIEVAPDLFQFKRNSDSHTGVQKGKEIKGDVDPAALNTFVLYEDIDNRRFIVHGHHRFNLIKRSGEDHEIRAAILREADGWSTDQARAYGAALNIRDNQGEVDDYATFFRESQISREAAEANGLLRLQKGRQGHAIGLDGSDNVFYGFIGGKVSAEHAAAVAESAPGDHDVQDMMLARGIKTSDLPIFAGYIRTMRNSGNLNLSGVQMSLFTGTDYEAMLAVMEKESRAAGVEAAKLDKQAASLEAIIKAGKILSPAEMNRHGVRAGNKAGMTERAAQLREESFRWKNFYQFPDVLAKVKDLAGTATDLVETYKQDSRNTDDALAASIKAVEIYDDAMTKRQINRPFTPLLPVNEKVTRLVKEKLGFDVSDLVHGIESGRVRHQENQHGAGNERFHDQMPIDRETFALYPLVVADPDTVYDAGITEHIENNGTVKKQQRILFEKDIGGKIYVVEGITRNERKHKRRLTFITMWKKDGESGVGQTSETPQAQRPVPRATDSPSSYSSIQPENDIVKPDESFQQRTLGEVDLYKSTPEQRSAAVIRAMKGANRSTVPHELAHIFFDNMRDMVMSGKADNATRRDFAKLLNFAGRLTIDSRLAKDSDEYKAQEEEVRDNIEKIARAFEQYLLEGRAPSMELVDSFSLFSSWLTRVYANIRQYVGHDLTRHVRSVYDHWLATDRQISEAQAYYGGKRGNAFLNLLDDEDERKRLEERRRHQECRLRQRFAGDMVGAMMESDAAREQLSEDARTAVDSDPVYRAIQSAREGRLNRAAAVSMVGEQLVTDIVDKHGNIFSESAQAKETDFNAVLSKAGYHGQDQLRTFLAELAEAEPVTEAVRRQGSHGRRKRYYEAAEAIRNAGGISLDAAAGIAGENIINKIIETHGEKLFAATHEGIDQLAVDSGFFSGAEMLEAMAKAPNAGEMLEMTFDRLQRERVAESRRWATEAVDVFADSALHNPQEDIDAETIDITRQAIHRALNERDRRHHAYTDRRIITERARAHLARLSLRKAANFSNWGMAERKWASRAAEAAAIGDRRAALEALDKQQYFHALVTEAFRIRQDFQRFQNRWSYRAARSGLVGVAYEYRQVMMDILHEYGIVKSRAIIPDASDPNRLTLPVTSDGFEVEGRKVDEDIDIFEPPLETLIPEWLKTKQKVSNYLNVKDLTTRQMYEMDETLGLLQNRGRGELHALRDEQSDTVEKKTRSLIEALEKLPDYKVTDQRSWFNRKKRGAERFIISNLMIDRIAAEVDGNPLLKGMEMGEMQNIIRLIRSREVGQMEMLEQFHADSKEDFHILDSLVNTFKKTFGSKKAAIDGAEIPDIMRERKGIPNWDTDMILSVYFNLGNRGNLYALQEGLGITDEQLATLESIATTEQWKAVERIAQRLESFYPLLDEVYFRMTNKHLPKVQATPFTAQAADGPVTLSGWYYPLVYDPELSDVAGRHLEQAEFIAGMNAIYSPSKPVDGFTRGRAVDEDGNPIVARPPLLKMSVMMNHMTTMTRWVTHVEPLYEFRRITMDSEFKEAFVKKLGADKYRYLREWTNRMARPDKGKNAVIGSLRNLSTTAALGLNIKSALRQTESFGIAADVMSKASRAGGITGSGWYWLIQGMKEMGIGGFLGSWVGYQGEAVQQMFGKSAEAKMRARNTNKEIREMIGRTDPTRRGIRIGGLTLSRDMFFHFTQAMDAGVAGVCWWGAYHQAVNGHTGIDAADPHLEEKAVAYADSILRTQQSPFAADFTRTQADQSAISLFTQFMGGVTPYLSHAAGVIQETRRGGISKTAMVQTLVNMYAIPAFVKTIIIGSIYSSFFGSDDDDETYGADFAWDVVSSISAPLPVVRDIPSIMQYGERSATPSSLALMGKTVSRTWRGIAKLAEGEIEEGASEFGKALLGVAPFSQAVKQATRLVETIGLIEED